jgi:hypothetical protein
VFVKHAVTDEAAEWLRKERVVYESVRGSFMPEYVGAVDARDTTLVVIEDLSAADWPPPWSRGRIDSALAALAEVQAAQPPAGLDALDAMREHVMGLAGRRGGSRAVPLDGALLTRVAGRGAAGVAASRPGGPRASSGSRLR